MMAQDSPGSHGTVLAGSVIAGLLFCGIFTTIGLFAPSLVLPQIAAEFAGVPHAELLTELVGTLASFSFALSAPVAGMLIARHGCRAIILPSLILFTIAGALPALLHDLWAILAMRVVLGIALAGIFTGALAGLGALRQDVRVRMFGWFSVIGGGCAILLFPAVGALGHIDWRLAFTVYLLAAPAVALIALLPAALGRVDRGRAEADRATGAQALIGPAMTVLLVLAGFTGMSMLMGPIYAPLYLTQIGVTDTRFLAIPVTLGAVAAVLVTMGYGKLHRLLGIRGVFMFALAMAGTALLLGGITTVVPLFTLAIVVQSAMTSLLAPNITAAAMAWSAPEKGAAAIGLANGVMFGSQLLLPFVAAPIRASAGLNGMFMAFGGAILVLALLVLVTGATQGRRSALA